MSKKFRSPNGKDIRVALLSGQVAVIGTEFRDLPEELWSEAYRMGAVSDDMKVKSTEEFLLEQKKELDRQAQAEHDELKDLLRSVYDNPKDFLSPNTGRPVHRKIVQVLGRNIKKETIETVWDEVVAEIPVED